MYGLLPTNRHTRGFTLTEVAFALGIIVSTVTVLLVLIGNALRQAQNSRDQLLGAAVATRVAESFATGGDVVFNGHLLGSGRAQESGVSETDPNARGSGPVMPGEEGAGPITVYRDVARNRKVGDLLRDNPIYGVAGQFDLEHRLVGPAGFLRPIPLSIAHRIDSPGDAIRKHVEAGGQIYYVAPDALDGGTSAPGALADSSLKDDLGRLIVAFVGSAQQSLLPYHPMQLPHQRLYPFPPTLGSPSMRRYIDERTYGSMPRRWEARDTSMRPMGAANTWEGYVGLLSHIRPSWYGGGSNPNPFLFGDDWATVYDPSTVPVADLKTRAEALESASGMGSWAHSEGGDEPDVRGGHEWRIWHWYALSFDPTDSADEPMEHDNAGRDWQKVWSNSLAGFAELTVDHFQRLLHQIDISASVVHSDADPVEVTRTRRIQEEIGSERETITVRERRYRRDGSIEIVSVEREIMVPVFKVTEEEYTTTLNPPVGFDNWRGIAAPPAATMDAMVAFEDYWPGQVMSSASLDSYGWIPQEPRSDTKAIGDRVLVWPVIYEKVAATGDPNQDWEDVREPNVIYQYISEVTGTPSLAYYANGQFNAIAVKDTAALPTDVEVQLVIEANINGDPPPAGWVWRPDSPPYNRVGAVLVTPASQLRTGLPGLEQRQKFRAKAIEFYNSIVDDWGHGEKYPVTNPEDAVFAAPASPMDLHPAQILALNYVAYASTMVTGYKRPFVGRFNDPDAGNWQDMADADGDGTVDPVYRTRTADDYRFAVINGAFYLPYRKPHAIPGEEDVDQALPAEVVSADDHDVPPDIFIQERLGDDDVPADVTRRQGCLAAFWLGMDGHADISDVDDIEERIADDSLTRTVIDRNIYYHSGDPADAADSYEKKIEYDTGVNLDGDTHEVVRIVTFRKNSAAEGDPAAWEDIASVRIDWSQAEAQLSYGRILNPFPPPYANDTDMRMAQTAVYNLITYLNAYIAVRPHCHIVPKPLNRQSSWDQGLYAKDPFFGQDVFTSDFNDANGAAFVQSFQNSVGMMMWGDHDAWFIPERRFSSPDDDNNREMARAYRRAIAAGRGLKRYDYRGNNDNPIREWRHAGTRTRSRGQLSDRWWFTKPFEVPDRTRQLVVWSAPWQSYEDFESAAAAPVDFSHLAMRHGDSAGQYNPITNQYAHPEERAAFANPNRDAGIYRLPPIQHIDQANGVDLRTGSAETGQMAFRNINYNPGRDWHRRMIWSSLGLWGADRNGNGRFDRGPMPANQRVRATEVGRYVVYDPVMWVPVR